MVNFKFYRMGFCAMCPSCDTPFNSTGWYLQVSSLDKVFLVSSGVTLCLGCGGGIPTPKCYHTAEEATKDIKIFQKELMEENVVSIKFIQIIKEVEIPVTHSHVLH